ncbi:MAG: glycosyltransferase [Solirubrobacterales bacterium]|nr:glycosyltransferase [Solirubrobacterales bacterium]
MTDAASPAADLLVTAFTPTTDRGRALRTYGVVAALARHRPVDVLYKRFGATHPSEQYAQLTGVRLHEIAASKGVGRALVYARGRLAGVPRGEARGFSPELATAALKAARLPGRGRVIADGPTAAALLAGRGIGFIYLAHNVESSLRPMLPRFRHKYGSEPMLRRFERGLLLAARECWMASRLDVGLARELAPQAQLRYVPNVVDVSAIRPPNGRVTAPRALFLADYNYTPNLNALRFLVEQVMPRVWVSLPEAELLLAGHNLELSPETDSRVRPLGFVEQVRDAYALARCVVVPLLEGGGSPLKFVEALAHGLPVIATGRAAAGLDVVDGIHYRRAEGPEAFAQALIDVLGAGAKEIGWRGRQLAERAYSIEALAAILQPQRGGA